MRNHNNVFMKKYKKINCIKLIPVAPSGPGELGMLQCLRFVFLLQLLKTATDMRPDYIQGYINRGDIYMKLNR